MSIPWCGKIGKGKFPQSSLKAHFIFPSHGLAVMVKKNFPSRGFAAPGEIFVSPVAAPPLLGKLFFTNPAKPFLGKIKCAFRDSWGNFYFPSRGFATPGENPLPYFSTPWDWANPFYLSMLQNFNDSWTFVPWTCIWTSELLAKNDQLQLRLSSHWLLNPKFMIPLWKIKFLSNNIWASTFKSSFFSVGVLKSNMTWIPCTAYINSPMHF